MTLLEYRDAITSLLAMRLTALALAALLSIPLENLPAGIHSQLPAMFALCMELLYSTQQEINENSKENGEVDYDKMLAVLKGESFKQNDWRWKEYEDVESDDMLDELSLKQLEELNKMEDDWVEIDYNLDNMVTSINDVAYVQQAFKVGVADAIYDRKRRNRNLKCSTPSLRQVPRK